LEKTVVELFAGVGGFRVGLNEVKSINKKGRAIEKNNFDFVWANQWEPSTKTQYAYDCYIARFGNDKESNINIDIAKIDKKTIPNHTLLCGGFPCQDYSVARSLSKEEGIKGTKGKLWWEIYDVLKTKRPKFVLLENVDRLIKSPSKQRGRDFGVMLYCFYKLGYSVEWRVINAADYGFPQRRRRIYIFAYEKKTIYSISHNKLKIDELLVKNGFFAKTFLVKKEPNDSILMKTLNDYNELVEVSDNFAFSFKNSGVMVEGNIHTLTTVPNKRKSKQLIDIIQKNEIDARFFLNEKQKKKISELRGSKKINRTNSEGKKYVYSEGSMSPYDNLFLPGRTMLTSEGTINRSTHIIKDFNNNELRVLTPVECERLNQFPDNWTDTMPEKKRYFMMGNALVCGVIKKMGKEISKIIDCEE